MPLPEFFQPLSAVSVPRAECFEDCGAVHVRRCEQLWKTTSTTSCFIEELRLGTDVRECFTEISMLVTDLGERESEVRDRFTELREWLTEIHDRCSDVGGSVTDVFPHVGDENLLLAALPPTHRRAILSLTDATRDGIARSTPPACRPGIGTSSAQTVIHIPHVALDATGDVHRHFSQRTFQTRPAIAATTTRIVDGAPVCLR